MTSALHLNPSPDGPTKNLIRFSPNGTTMLEMSSTSLRLTAPNGLPLIEANADGEVLVRGESMQSNQDIYESFVAWMGECMQALFKKDNQKSAPVLRLVQPSAGSAGTGDGEVLGGQ